MIHAKNLGGGKENDGLNTLLHGFLAELVRITCYEKGGHKTKPAENTRRTKPRIARMITETTPVKRSFVAKGERIFKGFIKGVTTVARKEKRKMPAITSNRLSRDIRKNLRPQIRRGVERSFKIQSLQNLVVLCQNI